jgi:hypothetical protein
MTPDDLADKLRRLPPRPICEHGSIKSKCTECELIDAEAEIAHLRTALAASEAKLAGAQWNIERDGDDLLICDGEHGMHEDCAFVRYVEADKIAAARADALEEAAKRCDMEEHSDMYPMDPREEAHKETARTLATAIRSLKEKT